jgi:HK97 family phage major capsid protein
MKNGRFDNGLLEFSPGEQLARAYRKDGLRASVQVEVRDFLLSEANDPMYVGYDKPEPMTPRRRPVHIRDLLNQVPTTEASTPYIRELNPNIDDQGGATVAEGNPAPKVTMQFAGVYANPVKRVSAWVPASEEVLMDAPGLSDYINGRLVEILYIRDDWQLLNGGGTGPDLLGILQTGPQTSSTGTTKRQAIANGIADVETAEAVVDAVVVNPIDAWAMFDANPFWPQELAAMGVTLVRTMALPQGTALAGAFRQAATLRVRKEATLRLATQADDDFVDNRIKLLAELREALNVTSPDLFCEVTLPTDA